MKRGFAGFPKRLVAGIVLALFVSEISVPVLGIAWADGVPLAQAGLNVSAVLKDEVGSEDSDLLWQPDELGRKANVLFMMDATAVMSFTPKSVMPSVVLASDWKDSGRPGADWSRTKSSYGYTVDDVISMMRNATYGIGAMPVAWSGANLRPERNLYGRELDNGDNYANNYVKRSNNIEEDLRLNGMNYYAPFKKEGYSVEAVKKGYESQWEPLEKGRNKSGIAAHVGMGHWDLTAEEIGVSQPAEYKYGGNGNISNAKNFPYALIFKNPDYWEKGMPGLKIGAKPASPNLVPNDSRMYQAKLALWKLLENEEALKGIRLGLASTFLPTTNDTNFSYAYVNKKYTDGTPLYYNKIYEVGGDHSGLKHRYDFSGMYKVEPFGTTVWTSRTFSGTTPGNHGSDGKTDGKKQYKNGVLVQAISGQIRGYNAIHAQYYPMWQHKTVETIYTSIRGGDAEILRKFYKLLHRGSLLVPIRGADEQWEGFGRRPMSQADRIRQWINGFADLYNGRTDDKVAAANESNRTKQYHYYKDPEIGVAGVFILPHAIYPDPRKGYGMTRDDYKKNILTAGIKVANLENKNKGIVKDYDGFETSVWYSHSLMNTDYEYDRHPGSTELEDMEAQIKNRFNAGSGEAVGSVLDFFSPPANRYSNLMLSDVSYPIRSACEPNWLIVITTGQELKPASPGDYTYTAAQAIKNLYDATNKETKNAGRSSGETGALRGDRIYAPYEQVSMLVRKNGKPSGNPTPVDLDKPIQTLVIGVVPKIESMSNPIEKKDVEEMYLNLVKMAVAGQGGNPDEVTLKNMGDFEAQPFIASDPSELMSAVYSALSMVRDSTVTQPAPGSSLQSESLDDLGGNSDMYSYSYRIMNTDQWEAEMTRDVVSRDEEGKLRFYNKWRLGVKDDVNIVPPNGDRKIYYWNPNGLSNSLSGLGVNDMGFRDASGLSSGAIVPPNGTDFGRVPPQDAFMRWLRGNDYSYSNKKDYKRSSMLADIGRGGVAMVNDPVAGNNETLPGYLDWAKGIKAHGKEQKPLLFAQTNDGLLRIIDPSAGGKELKAILPPPVLVPSRLAALKAGSVGDKRQWINVTSAASGVKSYPAFTLDGSLQRRNFDLDQTGNPNGWGKYLLGTLGRGGNGLYMIDVSSHEDPKVMWYRENVGGKLVSGNWTKGSGSTLVYSIADLSSAENKDLGYLKMGFNSPKPLMGVAPVPAAPRMKNYIALAGGVQSRIPPDISQNGDEGATLLMIEPKDGRIIRAFTGESLDPVWRVGGGVTGPAPYMGMMVSEPVAVRSAKNHYLTGSVIASDNRGNIFRVEMEDEATGTARDPDMWAIRTLATLQTDASKDSCSDSYSIPNGVVVAMREGSSSMWVAGGTADVLVKKNANDLNERGVLKNESQMIFSFISDKETDARPLTRNDLKELNADDPGSYFTLGSRSDAAFRGWHIKLKKDGHNTYREYVSARPLLENGILLIPTFIRKDKILMDDSSMCAPESAVNGDSRLYAVDIRTGKPALWSGGPGNLSPKYITLEGVKIVGLMNLLRGGQGYFLIKTHRMGADNIDELINKGHLLRARDGEGNESPGELYRKWPKPSGKGNVPPGQTLINYWIMK
jgi:hypothetical protein